MHTIAVHIHDKTFLEPTRRTPIASGFVYNALISAGFQLKLIKVNKSNAFQSLTYAAIVDFTSDTPLEKTGTPVTAVNAVMFSNNNNQGFGLISFLTSKNLSIKPFKAIKT